MKVEVVEDGQVYVNTRFHLITRHGKHICYIDIPHDAIVYTDLKYIKGDDWTLYVPAEIETLTENIPETKEPIQTTSEDWVEAVAAMSPIEEDKFTSDLSRMKKKYGKR